MSPTVDVAGHDIGGSLPPWVILGGGGVGVIIPWVNLSVTCNGGRGQLAAGRKTALRNAALAAAAADPEILPLEFVLGDDPFMDR